MGAMRKHRRETPQNQITLFPALEEDRTVYNKT
jgi:hypothetical protein